MPSPLSPRTLAGLALPLVLLLGACGGSLESDIRKRFAEKHDRPLCVEFTNAFPATAEFGLGRDIEKWLVALADGGLLSARELPPRGGLASAFGVRRVEFSLTDAGRQVITPENHFCYGRAEIVEVVDYTQPANVDGVQTLQAEARLRRRVDAEWARHPVVAELVDAGDQTVSMLLVKKAKGGWSPAY